MSFASPDCSQALAVAEQRIRALEQELATAQAAVATADQRLAILSEFIPEGLLLCDDEDRVIVFNHQLHELLLLPGTEHQWLGQSSANILTVVLAQVQDQPAFLDWVSQVQGSQQCRLDSAIRLRDGRTLQIDYVPISPKEPGRLHGRLLCFRDVTERQEVAYELAQQRAFYENILDCLPGELGVIDPDLRLRYVNAHAEPDLQKRAALLGKRPAEYLGWNNVSAATAANLTRAYGQTLDAGTPQTWEDAVRLPDGQIRHIQRFLSPVRDAYGQIYLLIDFSVDVSQRHLAEERTRALFAALPDTILVVNADGRVRDAKVGDTALELPKNTLKGSHLNQLLPANVLAKLLPCLAEARHSGEAGTCMFELRAADGTITYHAARLIALNHGQETLISLLNTTPQELNRRELAEQQAFVRQVVDTSPLSIYVRDASGKIVFSNHTFDKQARQSRHVPLIQKGTSEDLAGVQVEEEVALFDAQHAHVLHTQQELTYEISVTLASGQVRWFQLVKRPLRRADGTINVLNIALDITETKRARQKLERSQKKYRDLVQYSQALICTHDLEGNILTVNPAVERSLGMTAVHLIGRNLREVVLPSHQSNLQEYLKAFADHQEQRNTLAISTRMGEKRYLHCHTYLVSATDGKPTYVVAYAYDITDGLRAEKALRQAKREVEQGARAKEEFLASMSHEIRTPLNGVLGMAGLLAKTPLNMQQREFVDTIGRSGQHLLTVISDVLDMAKISAGLLQLERAPFDLCESVQGAVKSLTYLAEAKGVYLATECAPIAHSRVLGDTHRLNQVLLNLLSNAIKFTDYGSITLGCQVLAETTATLTLRFWVRDTGIGIPAEHQQRIFDTFAQASTNTTRLYGGSGLGLAISQHLVQRMGGMLTVASTPGQGSTFSFTLTLPRAIERAAGKAKVSVDYQGLQGRRVLLAEDNRVNQRVATLMLENWGIIVDCVPSGPDALQLIDERTYDLVLMDIQMPGMSGVEATTIIRRHPDPRRANLPIVALTANAFRRDREQYLAAGMTACMTKPFQERPLYELLLSLLSGDAVRAAQNPAPPATERRWTPRLPQRFTAWIFYRNRPMATPSLWTTWWTYFWPKRPSVPKLCKRPWWPRTGRRYRGVVHSVKPSLTLLQVEGLTSTYKALESTATPIADREVAARFLIQRLQTVCQSMAAHHGAGTATRLAG